ncbi:MAG: ABC transporter substrate-binding protein [Methyloprofundus sp.]|nr:ABC transporter substrate-binding protein [Methyloprofundus sp.]
MKISYLLTLLIIFAFLVWYTEHESKSPIQPSGNTVKVGIIAPFTGATKNRGTQGVKGIKIAQQLIPYLDNGDAIEWVAMDDEGIPERAINALKKLAIIHKVTAIIILSGSDSVLAVTKAAELYKTPILALLASHPDITKHSSYINQFNFDDTFQAAVAAFYVRDELLINRVAIMTEAGNVHFSYLANEFAKQFNSTEGVITDSYELTTNKQDYVQLLQSIKSKGPELLYLPVGIEHLFKIKLALAELDWNPKIMLSDGILASIKAQKKYPLDMMNGMLATDPFSYDMEFTDLGEQLWEQMVSMGNATQDIQTNSILSMEGYTLLIDVMNRCLEQQNKRLCINNNIRSTAKFEGVKGLISFDKAGRAHRSLSINRINAGLTEFVVQVY